MALEILWSVVEFVAGFGGLYALYQCMKHLRTVGLAANVADVWQRFSTLMVWAVSCCGALIACALAGGRSLGVVFLATLMALMVIGAGLLLAWLRAKSLQLGQGVSAKGAEAELVEIRSLVLGRVRGRDEAGDEVCFAPEQIDKLVGVRGHVRMLNWASARKSGSQSGGIAPLMGFSSVEGDAFVLYADDVVVSVGQLGASV